jgi:type II secretory pathway pseudopilin PulG
MMVAIVIVGVTSAIGIGRIQQLIVANRVQRAASAVQNDLEAAFAIAGRDRRPVRISWDASTMALGVTDRAGTTAFRHTTLGMGSYGLRAQDVTFSASPLEVYPNGLAQDTLNITIVRGNASKQVRMTRSGLVLVQ